jgi:hypothetical protein
MNIPVSTPLLGAIVPRSMNPCIMVREENLSPRDFKNDRYLSGFYEFNPKQETKVRVLSTVL